MSAATVQVVFMNRVVFWDFKTRLGGGLVFGGSKTMCRNSRRRVAAVAGADAVGMPAVLVRTARQRAEGLAGAVEVVISSETEGGVNA